jgi:hypothetical protein
LNHYPIRGGVIHAGMNGTTKENYYVTIAGQNYKKHQQDWLKNT